MAKASGSGGRSGRTISSSSTRGFRVGDRIEGGAFSGTITKVNPKSIRLKNTWGQTTKPLSPTMFRGANVFRSRNTMRGPVQVFRTAREFTIK